MSEKETPSPRPERMHQSHAETEARHYERVREAGGSADAARKLAKAAADRNHREWDRRKRSD